MNRERRCPVCGKITRSLHQHLTRMHPEKHDAHCVTCPTKGD